ncbi:MAG: hypothetical protein IT317_04015 [Anaerolineales bacterium]|nr:hypothetical protein [Anaerolineales bacterium]
MPDLRRVLADHDLALLRLIAELWGQGLAAGSQREAVDELAAAMLQPERAAALVADLPPAARAAFETLARPGRQPLAAFARRHGELRAMGPARRDREKPWANAPTATETLWYRGLIGRAFFSEAGRHEEYLFVPDDLRSLVYVAPAADAAVPAAPPGRPLLPSAASAANVASAGPPASLAAADDSVTLLAYLQVITVRAEAGGALDQRSPAPPAPGSDAPALPARHAEALARYLRQPEALPLYLTLLRALGLLTEAAREPFQLIPEKVQPYLQASPAARLRALAEAWRGSPDWNDLLHVPGLAFEGVGWRNDPLAARQAVLALLAAVPAGVWWSTPAFVTALKDRQPDFQRPAGDYDSWYIRAALPAQPHRAAGGAYLRGFENWDRVDGALVRWLIGQPLRWLGLVEVAPTAAEPGFRLTPYGAALLDRAAWDADADPSPVAALDLDPTGLVRVPGAAPAYDRFQLARLTDWLPPEAAGGVVYPYRLSPAALARAARKGITVPRIIQFLERAAAGHSALPALAAALRRWEHNGPEAALLDTVVLRLATPEVLDLLRRTPSVRDLLGESLGPAAVAVRRERAGELRAALAALGLLTDGDLPGGARA